MLELKLNLVESRTFFDFVIIKQAQVPLAEFHLKMEDGTIYFYYINCDWNCNYITDEICKFHEFMSLHEPQFFKLASHEIPKRFKIAENAEQSRSQDDC